MQSFTSLSLDEQLEILRSVASDSIDDAALRSAIVSIADREREYSETVQNLPAETKGMILSKMYEKKVDDLLEQFSCEEDSYEDVVDKLIEFCIIENQGLQQYLNENRKDKIAPCVKGYKSQFINKCNNTSLRKVSIKFDLPGFISRQIKYDAPFLPDSIILESVDNLGTPLQAKVFSIQITYDTQHSFSMSGEFHLKDDNDFIETEFLCKLEFDDIRLNEQFSDEHPDADPSYCRVEAHDILYSKLLPDIKINLLPDIKINYLLDDKDDDKVRDIMRAFKFTEITIRFYPGSLAEWIDFASRLIT